MRSIHIDHSITNRSELSLQRYLYDISKLELIKADEEVVLARKIKEGDDAALAKLVRSNLRFVVSCAKKYQHLGLPLADLINEGNIGLIKAARLFDETKGFKFISYAVWWIRQSIMMALSLDVRMIRLPQNMVKMTAEIRKTSEKLEQVLERVPTQQEICEQLYVPSESIAMDYAFGRTVVSLDSTVREDSDMQLWSALEDKNSIATDELVNTESLDMDIKRLLSTLNQRDQRILIDFFGFSGNMPKSLDDIAIEMKLSRERIRQLKEAALQRLRNKAGERRYSYV
ncbi:sigma-70 family RNA polymerase sigma factor [Pedobacter sp. LMG 31464]|uniref:Sigma-70 family RNA polymerase sigma factor n=1 Tax=Pedobacter planticolens TaxID=2679964 RepID=A0A923DZ83_9SPHI|nr:RNA polymerase sigma factor RpoD/SigA [Pedobacter planticolens]MBB2146796.1 sigma-70 family RNA polymerase sigma factor [Pedobacter planticolens]